VGRENKIPLPVIKRLPGEGSDREIGEKEGEFTRRTRNDGSAFLSGKLTFPREKTADLTSENLMQLIKGCQTGKKERTRTSKGRRFYKRKPL